MSEDNPPYPPIMERIEHLDGILHNLKKVALTSENEDHIASAMLEEHNNMYEASRVLLLDMKETSETRGYAVSERLFSLLHDIEPTSYGSDNDLPPQWSRFHNQLKAIEGTGEYFRSCCLYPQMHKVDPTMYIVDNATILHDVCCKNPPAEVVRTLLALLPSMEPKHYRRKQISPFDRFGYCPLHKAIQHGGSLEVMKLLVNADHEKETLKVVKDDQWRQKDSVYHMLIANRNMHQPEGFSEILQYLCCVGISMKEPPLLQQASSHENKIPLLLLVQSLIKEGLTGQHITRNKDYIFLLKATCYHYKSSLDEIQPQINDIHLTHQEIEAISLSEAFLVCAPCFGEKIGDRVLNELLSVDCQFLFEEDSVGQYPIHRMITEESYFMDTVTTRLWSGGFLSCILKIVLKHAPKSAQLVNKEGRLPLHVVSDYNERHFKDSDRLDLVSIILNAYPEATETLDGKSGLPPFALASRKEEGGPKKQKTSPMREAFFKDDAFAKMLSMVVAFEEPISSSFFLLRQQPDIISNYIVSGDDTGSTFSPVAKRTKTNDV